MRRSAYGDFWPGIQRSPLRSNPNLLRTPGAETGAFRGCLCVPELSALERSTPYLTDFVDRRTCHFGKSRKAPRNLSRIASSFAMLSNIVDGTDEILKSGALT